MKFKEQTLDLTGLNRFTFHGSIRIRHIADWAHDYWKEGYTLARIKLHNEEYRELIHEIHSDNIYAKAVPDDILSINLGFGEIEIINVDDKKQVSFSEKMAGL